MRFWVVVFLLVLTAPFTLMLIWMPVAWIENRIHYPGDISAPVPIRSDAPPDETRRFASFVSGRYPAGQPAIAAWIDLQESGFRCDATRDDQRAPFLLVCRKARQGLIFAPNVWVVIVHGDSAGLISHIETDVRAEGGF